MDPSLQTLKPKHRQHNILGQGLKPQPNEARKYLFSLWFGVRIRVEKDTRLGSIYGGFHSHGGTPSYHPSRAGIFHETNHPGTPHIWSNLQATSLRGAASPQPPLDRRHQRDAITSQWPINRKRLVVEL